LEVFPELEILPEPFPIPALELEPPNADSVPSAPEGALPSQPQNAKQTADTAAIANNDFLVFICPSL
jgi:hypothetical protein